MSTRHRQCISLLSIWNTGCRGTYPASFWLIDCLVLPALATWQLAPMQTDRKIADNHSHRGTNNHTPWGTNNHTSSGRIIKALGGCTYMCTHYAEMHIYVVRGQPMIRMENPALSRWHAAYWLLVITLPCTCCAQSRKMDAEYDILKVQRSKHKDCKSHNDGPRLFIRWTNKHHKQTNLQHNKPTNIQMQDRNKHNK